MIAQKQPVPVQNLGQPKTRDLQEFVLFECVVLLTTKRCLKRFTYRVIKINRPASIVKAIATLNCTESSFVGFLSTLTIRAHVCGISSSYFFSRFSAFFNLFPFALFPVPTRVSLNVARAFSLYTGVHVFPFHFVPVPIRRTVRSFYKFFPVHSSCRTIQRVCVWVHACTCREVEVLSAFVN